MQLRSPYANSVPAGEIGRHRFRLLHEPNSSERIADVCGQLDAKPGERLLGRWHQSFTASFVDDRLGPVRNRYAKSSTPSRNRGR
jgi:hypothetical protein